MRYRRSVLCSLYPCHYSPSGFLANRAPDWMERVFSYTRVYTPFVVKGTTMSHSHQPAHPNQPTHSDQPAHPNQPTHPNQPVNPNQTIHPDQSNPTDRYEQVLADVVTRTQAELHSLIAQFQTEVAMLHQESASTIQEQTALLRLCQGTLAQVRQETTEAVDHVQRELRSVRRETDVLAPQTRKKPARASLTGCLTLYGALMLLLMIVGIFSHVMH